MLRLRCKTEDGTQTLNDLTSASTLMDLMEAIRKMTGIDPGSQKILSGFPPKSMNLEDRQRTLESFHVKSGDTFTVVNRDKNSSGTTGPRSVQERGKPGVRRKEVPADNSCLFYSVFYLIEGTLDYETAKELRAQVARKVISNPEKFSEAVLGKTPDEYSAWIQSDTSWGGAIELSILAEIYQIELAAVDIKTLRMDIYGQEHGFSNRAYLIYDGIHYDPLFYDPCDPLLPVSTIFLLSDDVMQKCVLALALDAKNARQYTDTGNFTLLCVTCQRKLTGDAEAQEHAKRTGHGNFSEC